MKISVAHATRRPEQAIIARAAWLAAAVHPENVEWIFGVDADDEESLRVLSDEPRTISVPGGNGVAAFNAAAAKTTGEIIIGGCDDFFPPPRWDEEIVRRFQNFERGTESVPLGNSKFSGSEFDSSTISSFPPLVLLTGDGYRPDRLATLPIITRAWYERFGFLFPPKFQSVGPDVWLTERASRNGCLVNAEDLVFEHRHPYYKKAPMDDVYAKQNEPEKYHRAKKILDELLTPLPISLCMIVGNEAEQILRCLDSAKEAFDQLCIVRAIGNQTADVTMRLARDWCVETGKDFSGADYRNTIEFPHVDDFAAARNLSFSLATNYWCFWLDADDILETPASIREAATNTRFDGHQFRYLMPTGGEFYRERLIKRGAGTWKDPVHETCTVNGTLSCVPQVIIRHAPPSGERAHHGARNLAILQAHPEKLQCPRARFYLHEELLRLERRPEAIETGIKLAAELNGSMPAEHYEVLLNLADLQPEKAADWSFQALQLDPLRREAVAMLVQNALHCGDVRHAVQYFRFLDSIPEPDPKPWTHRKIWHGWARNYLKVKILRAARNDELAASEHAKFSLDPAYVAGIAEYETPQI